jgi:hypothetical protein
MSHGLKVQRLFSSDATSRELRAAVDLQRLSHHPSMNEVEGGGGAAEPTGSESEDEHSIDDGFDIFVGFPSRL